MARELKVYGATTFLSWAYDAETGERVQGQVQVVVAATTMKEAARQAGMSVSTFRTFGSETRNAEDIAAATAQPGRVMWRPTGGARAPLRPITEESQAKMVAAVDSEAEARVQERERKAQRDAERAQRAEYRRQADRAAQEMLEDHAEMLDDLGFGELHTDGAGNVKIPVESLVGLLRRLG